MFTGIKKLPPVHIVDTVNGKIMGYKEFSKI
jgi:hypothetical protein